MHSHGATEADAEGEDERSAFLAIPIAAAAASSSSSAAAAASSTERGGLLASSFDSPLHSFSPALGLGLSSGLTQRLSPPHSPPQSSSSNAALLGVPARFAATRSSSGGGGGSSAISYPAARMASPMNVHVAQWVVLSFLAVGVLYFIAELILAPPAATLVAAIATMTAEQIPKVSARKPNTSRH